MLVIVTADIIVVPSLADNKIVDVEQGARSTFVVMANGTIWSCGQNFGGILADGTMNDRCVLGPTFLDNVKKLAISDCGVALKTDGTVWTWGNNRGNVRGYETSDNLSFDPVPNMTNVKDIFSSQTNVFAIKNDGTVWAWGTNDKGSLGDGTTEVRTTPVQITGLPNDITMIRSSGYTTLALDSHGHVWAWGYNRQGEVGDGNNTDIYAPVLIPIDHVTSIAAAGGDSYALKDDGTVWAWGSNQEGQLGNGDTSLANQNTPVEVKITNVKTISASWGSSDVMALKNDGTVWIWGHYTFGTASNSPSNDIVPHELNITDVTAIYCGSDVFFVLKSDGSLWGWGDNYNGEVGVGWSTPNLDPTMYDLTYSVSTPTRVLDPGATPIPTIMPTPNRYILPSPTPTPTPAPTPTNMTTTPTGSTNGNSPTSQTTSPTVTGTQSPTTRTPTSTPDASQASGPDSATTILLITIALAGSLAFLRIKRK